MIAILTLILTTLTRAFRVWRASGSAMSVCWLVLSILPINVGMVEPFLYRQHEFMLGWAIMLGVSLGEWRSGQPRIPEHELPEPVPGCPRPAGRGKPGTGDDDMIQSAVAKHWHNEDIPREAVPEVGRSRPAPSPPARGWAQWRVIAAITLVLTALALVYAYLATPTYTARAEVVVDPRISNSPSGPEAPTLLLSDALVVDSELKVLSSREVTMRSAQIWACSSPARWKLTSRGR